MSTRKNVGRNDPCPCGSGKKYKRCCLPDRGISAQDMVPSPEVLAEIRNKMLSEQTRRAKFGEGRPAIHINWDGHKFVFVGNEGHYAPEGKWPTFVDFLIRHYIWTTIDSQWWQNELSKKEESRHEMLKWYGGMCRFLEQQRRASGGKIHCIPNGVMLAFILLAYDLYTIRHNAILQHRVIERLKNNDQFQGARHELFAAATCVRAGYDIAYEDEGDRSKRHPEFIATYRKTGQVISVEAKCHQRRANIALSPEGDSGKRLRLRIGALLNDALGKKTEYPYAIFLEFNLPAHAEQPVGESWLRSVSEALNRTSGATPDRDGFDSVVFTNHPQRHGLDDQPARLGFTRSVIGRQWGTPDHHPEFLTSLHDAATKYANIPQTFDEA